MKVQRAKFDKLVTKTILIPSHHPPLFKKPYKDQKTYLRDHKSYREVTSPHNEKIPRPPYPKPIATHHTQPLNHQPKNPQELEQPISPNLELSKVQEMDPQPDFFLKNPSKARITSTKILGEATEEARENIIAENVDDEFTLVISGSRNLDNLELFNRSIVAVAMSSLSSNEIWNCILAEGVFSLTIKPLGGFLHLITFDSMEEKIEMMNSKWLEKWFIEFRQVNDTIASQWREVILHVYGVPLTAWNYDNFHEIGSVFGRVLSIDYSQFDKSKILMITDCLFRINCKLWLDIGGTRYPIFIFETESQMLAKPSIIETCQNPLPKPQPKPDDMERGLKRPDDDVIDQTLDLTDTNVPSLPNDFSKSPPPKITAQHNNQETFNSPKTPSTPPFLENQIMRQNNNCNSSNKQKTPFPMNCPPSPKTLLTCTESPSNRKNQSPISIKPPLSPRKIDLPSPRKSLNLNSFPTSNCFGPLQKNKSSSLSSLDSGPLFPPGCEESIPNHTKISHALRRQKKLKKKQLRRTKVMKPDIPKPSPTSSSPTTLKPPNSPLITPDDILIFAEKLGMSYNQPKDDLRAKITDILNNHQLDWVSNQ